MGRAGDRSTPIPLRAVHEVLSPECRRRVDEARDRFGTSLLRSRCWQGAGHGGGWVNTSRCQGLDKSDPIEGRPTQAPPERQSVRIEDVVDAIRHNRIRITDHADEEAQADHLSFDEIFFSVFQGEIIED